MNCRDSGDMVAPPPDVTPPADFDVTQRYVRVTGERPNGLIEFEFSVGDPELFAELILTPDAFADFCQQHSVIILPVSATSQGGSDCGNGQPDCDVAHNPDGTGGKSDWEWRLKDARDIRFR